MLPEQLVEHPAASALALKFPEAILGGTNALGELTLIVAPMTLVEVCRSLRADHGFDRISAVTAVDWWPRDPRFEVVYHLHSIKHNTRLRLKVDTDAVTPVDSVTPVWRGANWYEREVFDLFGILFNNHPNLERIMMPTDWEGHPLRKDFPVHGFKYSYQDE